MSGSPFILNTLSNHFSVQSHYLSCITCFTTESKWKQVHDRYMHEIVIFPFFRYGVFYVIRLGGFKALSRYQLL